MTEFEKLVKQMRDAQNAYFDARKSGESGPVVYAKLDAARTLEKKVDEHYSRQMAFDLS